MPRSLRLLLALPAQGGPAADPGTELDTVRTVSPALHAAGALALLLAATVLSVIKPRGVTRSGRRSRSVSDGTLLSRA